MSLAEVCAVLYGEPWLMRPWEVKQLTLTQIFEVFFWPRDEHGKIILEPKDETPQPTYKEIFYTTWRMRRLPEHLIDRKWSERET